MDTPTSNTEILTSNIELAPIVLAPLLSKYYPGQAWSLTGDDYAGLTWYEENTLPKPTRDELVSKYEEYVATQQPIDELRIERNTLLEQTDRYATLDYPHPTAEAKQAWFDYRQALRDLPETTEDPATPVWPTPPK
jgi:hypothetical protein